MSSSDRSEQNSKADDPYERMLIFLTGKGSEDRKSKEKAIRFPVKVREGLHLLDTISTTTSITAVTLEQIIETAILQCSYPTKVYCFLRSLSLCLQQLMYIIQCGDYSHLIDWIEEEEEPASSKDKNNGFGETNKKCEKKSNQVTESVIEKNNGLCGEVKTDNSHDKMNDEGNDDLHSKSPPSNSTAFIIHDTTAFETHVLPAIFKEGKFDSFERKLYRWGFAIQKATGAGRSTDFSLKTSSSCSIYEHPYFCKGDYATASRIACSGSEVKRYKQIHKDKKNQSRKRKRRSSSKVVSFVDSTFRSMDASPSLATPPIDMKMAAATNINNLSSSTQRIPPKDNHLYIDQEDRWDALYLSALRNEEEEEISTSRDCKDGHEEENDEVSDTFMDSSSFREDFMPTSVMASNVQYHSHKDRNDEEQRMEERGAQSFGLNVTTTHDQAMLVETNSSTMTNMLLLQQEQDTILLQHLRRRRNGRQNILETIQRSHEN